MSFSWPVCWLFWLLGRWSRDFNHGSYLVLVLSLVSSIFRSTISVFHGLKSNIHLSLGESTTSSSNITPSSMEKTSAEINKHNSVFRENPLQPSSQHWKSRPTSNHQIHPPRFCFHVRPGLGVPDGRPGAGRCCLRGCSARPGRMM